MFRGLFEGWTPILILAVILNLVIAWFVAGFAAKRGHSWPLYFWFGFLVSWLLMLILALALPQKTTNRD